MRQSRQRRLRLAASTALAVLSVLLLTSAPAVARDGRAFTSDNGDIAGHTSFDDDIDVYTVYDDDADSVGVVGWIEVQQADQSWRPFPRMYVGTGNGTHRSNYKDIIRESATVRIWACRQNGSSGSPFNCGRADVRGGA